MKTEVKKIRLYSEIAKDDVLKLKSDHKKILKKAFENNLISGSGMRHYFSHDSIVDPYNIKYINDLINFGMLSVRDEEKKYYSPMLDERERVVVCKCPYLTEYGVEIYRILNLGARKNQSGHNRILADLITAKEDEDLLVVGDMEIQTKYGISRPDVLTMKKTLNTKYMCPTAFEVKHSRSDFLSDIKNENKRKSYLEIADKLYYVCPENLIKKEEMPEGCGLIYQMKNGKFKIVKSAKNHKVEINVNLMMKFLLRLNDVNNSILIKAY